MPVPDVEGLDVIAATNALREAGFIVNPSQVEEASEEIEEGKVIRTEPAADQLAAVGSQVDCGVDGSANGDGAGGDGSLRETAIQILRDELLDVAVIFEQVPAGSPSDGRVMAQDPAPFEEVEIGLVVTITVGEARTTTTGRGLRRRQRRQRRQQRRRQQQPPLPPRPTRQSHRTRPRPTRRRRPDRRSPRRASEETVVDLRVLVGVAYH